MMRRRAAPVVRVLGECARCGATPREVMTAHVVMLRMADGLPREHDVRVCRACEARPHVPTSQERAAAALDATNPLHGIEYFAQYRADLARVQRSAAHFLGAAAWAQLVLDERARREASDDGWDERYQQQWRDAQTEDDFLGKPRPDVCAPADVIDDEWAREL